MADFKQGAKESALGRRKLIRNTMFGALALFPLSGVVLLRDLGPLPGHQAPPHRCGPRASCSST